MLDEVEHDCRNNLSPRGYLHEFDFRAEHVHKAVSSS